METMRTYAPADLIGDPSRWWETLNPYPGNGPTAKQWKWNANNRWKVLFVQTPGESRRVVEAVAMAGDVEVLRVVFRTASHSVPHDAYSAIDNKTGRAFAEHDGRHWMSPPDHGAIANGQGGQVIEASRPSLAEANGRLGQILATLTNIERSQAATIELVKGLARAEKELSDRNRMLLDVLKEVETAEAAIAASEQSGRIGSLAARDFANALSKIRVAAEIPF